MGDFSEHDLVLRDWSTDLHSPSSSEEELLQEIGRQFSAISKEPSRARAKRSGAQIHGPNLKRLSAQGLGDSLAKKTHVSKVREMNRSQDSLGELLPPLQSTVVKQHDGAVVHQLLEDTKGIKAPESPELYVSKSKTRLSVMDMVSSRPTSASPSEPALVHAVSNDDSDDWMNSSADEEQNGSPSGQSILRTTLLLERKEEGDKETK